MTGPSAGPSGAATLRDADPAAGAADAAACARIYAPYVSDSAVSFEELAPDEGVMRERMESMMATHPWIVACEGGPEGEVVGFAYASPHRARVAYRWAADVSIYVATGAQRRGLGRMLYSTLFDLLGAQGIYVACAGITLPNAASVALHEALGFCPIGEYRSIGYKHGAWRDVGWWQLDLAARPEGGPPPDPGPPRRLRSSGGRSAPGPPG